MAQSYDMVVIGGGPGGYVAALRGRQLGLSVALVEKERLGGVCLNRGCIPTKALLSDVEGLLWTRRAAKEGILVEEPSADFRRVMQRKSAVVEQVVTNLEKHVAGAGVTTVHGSAKLIEPGAVTVDSGQVLQAKRIILASGSRSWSPPIPGADLPGVVTTRQILEVEKAPERLVIVGGGIIGQELAAIFSALGSTVTVLEALDRILLGVDAELARKYLTLLRGRGVSCETGVTIGEILKTNDRLRVVYEKKSKEKATDADMVLMATGRRPYTEGLGIEDAGIRTENGAVTVDRCLRTSAEGVYAIGDVIGGRMLAHVASHHGEIAAENIAGRERSREDDVVPSCVFTIPQIAWAGLTEEEAQAAGRSFRTSTFPLSASGKAAAMGEPRGWVKLIEDSQTGRLIGAHMMGPHVSELASGLTLAIRSAMTSSDIVDTIHPHPTISECIREAALGFFDGPIHSAARTKSHNPPS